jgi:uncharacterized membrane protein YbjE (DUF340 family)
LNEDTNEWECEDECLESQGDLLCGTTSHFTSFALLLAGTSECGSSNLVEQNRVIYILSAIFIGVAIIIAIIAAVAADVRVRWRQHKFEKAMRRNSSKIQQMTTSSS